MNLKDYQRLRDRLDDLQKRQERIAGAIEETLATIQKEFGCKTVKEAKELLEQITREEAELEAELEAGEKEFIKTYGDRLEKLE